MPLIEAIPRKQALPRQLHANRKGAHLKFPVKTAMLMVASVFLCGASSPAQQDERVEHIVERTKNTEAVYSVYNWNWITVPGQPQVEEWSAEFNSGALHRVETPRERVVANCQTKTGSALSLATGEMTSGSEVAGVACGINTNKQFLAMELVGRVSSRFGDADRVRLTDNDLIRTYDISDEGTIIRTIFELNGATKTTVLDDEAVIVERKLPSSDIFSTASLKESVVPSQFKIAPKASH